MRTGVLRLALVSFLAGLTPSASAQEAESADLWSGHWSFMAGWQRLDNGALDGRLDATGFPTFSSDALSLGGGGWAIRDRLVIGGNGHGLIVGEHTTSDGAYRTSLAGGFGQLDIGYRLFANERASLIPVAGFGAGAMTLEIVEQGSATFDEILSDPRTMSRISAWGFLLDAGVAADVRVTGARDVAESESDTRSGFSIGVRVGYTFWPGDWTWDVPGGPDVAIRGAYVRVLVGGWAG